MSQEYKFITIEQVCVTGKKQHPKYAVYTKKDKVQLGTIEYYQQWRKYIFAPDENTIYDAQCLRDITEFLESPK